MVFWSGAVYVIIFNIDFKVGESMSNSSEPTSPQSTELEELERYECRACGYVYEPQKGDSKREIASGTAFAYLPKDWRCPVCGARKTEFQNLGPASEASGFRENYGYGLGVNTLSPGQKNLLIFGGLALAVLFFISLYGLN